MEEICTARLVHDDYIITKQEVANGTLEIVDDPQLKDKGIGEGSDRKTLVHKELWRKMVSTAEVVEKAVPPEQLWILNDNELGRLEGAIVALNWVLEEHNEPLFSFLISERFHL